MGVGATNLAAVISMTGVLVTLMLRRDRKINRLEQRIDRRFNRMEDPQQRLEAGQGRMEGELAIIREALFASPAAGD